MTAFYTDQIEEFNLALSSVVLYGIDWKLCIAHEMGNIYNEYSENYPSAIILKMVVHEKKRKFERIVFKLGYSKTLFEEGLFANNDYSTINSDYIANPTKEGLEKVVINIL